MGKLSMNKRNPLHFIFLLALVGNLLVTSIPAQDTDEVTMNSSLNRTINGINTDMSVINQSSDILQDMIPSEKIPDVTGTPEIYSGVVHPNEETDVKSSTPEGDPLLAKYAKGGFCVDIMGHLMEGRGDSTNVSSEISFHDHTDVNGYVTTLMKDFHYVSKVDTQSEEWA